MGAEILCWEGIKAHGGQSIHSVERSDLPKTNQFMGAGVERTEESGRQRASDLGPRELVVIWSYQSGSTRRTNSSDYLKRRI